MVASEGRSNYLTGAAPERTCVTSLQGSPASGTCSGTITKSSYLLRLWTPWLSAVLSADDRKRDRAMGLVANFSRPRQSKRPRSSASCATRPKIWCSAVTSISPRINGCRHYPTSLFTSAFRKVLRRQLYCAVANFIICSLELYSDNILGN